MCRSDVCVAPTRFLVQEGAYEAFLDGFVEAARAIKVGHGLEDGTTWGRSPMPGGSTPWRR